MNAVADKYRARGARWRQARRTGLRSFSVTRFGYEKQELALNLERDTYRFLEVALSPRPILLDSLTVVGALLRRQGRTGR